jgi:Ca-activated chloride channel family protein
MSEAIFSPVIAGEGQQLQLAMQRLWLTGRVLPAGARLLVQHVFRSGETRPLEVIYSFPLPRDAALRSFRIEGDGFDAHSELLPRADAAKKFEQGIAAGSLSALAQLYRDGVVNLTVGNIRPGEQVIVHLEILAGVELRDDGFRFRFPFTLAPAYHSRMRAAQVEGEGEIELPPDEFGDVILPRYREDASGLHEIGFDLAISHTVPIDEIGSPSHSIRVKQNGARVALAGAKDVPNRDLVLDIRYSGTESQVLFGSGEDGKRHFAAVIPSTVFGTCTIGPRRAVILLDRSGSMQGEPMTQARNAIEACLATLTNEDQFGLVAFDNQTESLGSGLLAGTRENRDRARTFLSGIDARGGTELLAGVTAAAKILDGAGEIMIVTDGQVSGTEDILERAHAAGVRLSCLGIGSASQDRFLSLLARATGGVSRFVTPRERVDLAAVDLFASIARPVATDITAGRGVQPAAPGAVYAGTPLLLFGETDRETDLEIAWSNGRATIPIPAGDAQTGEAVRLLRGSRLITDLESRYTGGLGAALDRRQDQRVANRLAELSRAYGLASREMSLVAVVSRKGDQAGELPETRVVPLGMPQDVKFGSYFGAPRLARVLAAVPSSLVLARLDRAMLSDVTMGFCESMPRAGSQRPAPPALTETDEFMTIASELEPDGGLPGKDISDRAARSAAALLAFVAAGHTERQGAFRLHVHRLLAFLRSLAGLPAGESELIRAVIAAAESGKAWERDWLKLARDDRGIWPALRKAAAHSQASHK